MLLSINSKTQGLVFGYLTKCCLLVNALDNDHPSNTDQLSPALVWIATMTTQLIMLILAGIGILLIPLLSSRPWLNQHVMVGLIGMAAGALLADAIVHLIPHSLFPHTLINHLPIPPNANRTPPRLNASNDQQLISMREHTLIPQMSIALTMLLVVAGAYFFYLIELIMHARRKYTATPLTGPIRIPTTSNHYENGLTLPESDFQTESVQPVAWLILIGDSVHNFFDGLAVGVSYSTSWSLGLSTSLAVLLHELPHELGDYAVLLESGIPKYRAAVYNMTANLTAFVGAAVGISTYYAISHTGQNCVLAVTAGGFIYIALADLIPLVFKLTFSTSTNTPGVPHLGPQPPRLTSITDGALFDNKSSSTSTSSFNSIDGNLPTGALIPSSDAIYEGSKAGPYSLIISQNIGLLLGIGFIVYIAIYQESAH